MNKSFCAACLILAPTLPAIFLGQAAPPANRPVAADD